jgi:hypothetical protein
MTFWQGFVIQVMGSLGMVDEKSALQIQNLLICIEMLIASLLHFYIFPYHEWQVYTYVYIYIHICIYHIHIYNAYIHENT